MSNDLYRLIKQTAVQVMESEKPAALLFGEIIEVNPLKILVDQKLLLEERHLILTNAVKDHSVDITVNHVTALRSGGAGDPAYESHDHDYVGKKKIMVHNGLKKGEEVILIRVPGGQRFAILDRTSPHITEGEWL